MTTTARKARAWAGWLVLAGAGQLAVLLLTRAGHGVHYQHFAPWTGADPVHLAARLVLLAQAAIVASALVRYRAAVGAAIRALLPGWRLPAVGAAFVLSAATLSRDPRVYALELSLAALALLLQLVTVALAAAAMPAGRLSAAVERWLGPAGGEPRPGGPDRFTLLVAAWTVAASYALAALAYQRHPHLPDEVIYLYHARYFAQGLLALPAPPVPEAFSIDLVMAEATRWFSPVPPGWPAVLAVGVALGVPWLVNPVLAGVNVLLTGMVLREVYPPRTARLTVLLLGASPWALFMAMNLTTHTLSTTAALGAAYAVARMRRSGAAPWALLGGAALGVVGLVRPLEGFAVALLLGLWSLPARWRGVPLLPSALLTLSTMAASAVNLPYNRAMTGDARTFPIMAYTDKLYGPGTNALGFGPNRGLGWSGLDPFPGHGLRDVLVNTDQNVFQLHVELLGWGCGSLLAVWLLLAGGRLRRADLSMLAVVAMIAGLHAFYWFSGGPDFGARYWYLVLVPLLALAARGIEDADERLVAAGAPAGVAWRASALLTLLALLVFVPWRAADKYRHYRGMRPDVRALAAEREFGRSLVLVRGNRHPDYHSAATYNPLDLAADAPVYAWDRGAEVRARLLAAFPGRPVWVLEGPTVTKDGFRVAAGPLTADQARALP
jgi:hypothetical protein